ncbi:MAG: homocysteine S-methyltransferase family protein [Candidatus Aminicenantes bacterium]|nr:homocysteine S-methyltransferase family protein [Candidatus Aminicenantes bacterium]
MNILETVRERTLLLDGAMGTELMRAGLEPGRSPDAWNLDNPEAVRAVHARYFAAGSDLAVTNTFGATPLKLAAFGLQERCRAINMAGARILNEVRPEGRYVGGDIGPTGKFLKPQGEFAESQFEDAFARQAEALAEGGVDMFLIETMYDLREALCAVRACRKVSPLPVFATLTFNRTRRGFFTLMGDSPARGLADLEKAGAAAVGANCTLDSADMADLVEIMRTATSLPLIAQPNAGQPQVGPGGEVVYSQGLEDYVSHFPRILDNGARLIGGCCGTTPETIRRLAGLVEDRRKTART